MKVTLIHNPEAGEDGHPPVEELLALIRTAGHVVTYRSSKDDHWDGVLVDPGDLVAVAGGDGTVRAVAGRLIGRRVPIAILPLGTANNIATTLGLTDMSLEGLITGWTTARGIGFDAGVVHGPWGPTHFIEGVGVGLFTQTMSRLDARDGADLARPGQVEGKMTSGLRRLREGLRDCPAKELKLMLDRQDLSGAYILLEVMNIPYIGPNLHLAPDADPGDGHLDVVLLTAGERDNLGEYLADRLEGNSYLPRWTVASGQRLQLQCEGSDIHIDDEVWPGRGSSFTLSPMALDVRVHDHALEFLA
jgi:diacylglycerol kinase family enzyme